MKHRRMALIAVGAMLVGAGCTSGSDDGQTGPTSPEIADSTSASTASDSTASTASPTTAPRATPPATTAAPTTVPEPARSAVDLDDVAVAPIPAGAGVAQSTATVERGDDTGALPTLSPAYVETEYLLSGSADTYTGSVVGTPEVGTEETPYTTRLLVRRPADAADFSGRVVLEPFNTSGTADVDALWTRIGPLLESNGDAWVAVTDRATGAAENVAFDPIRYADLDLPTNDFAWDILRQVGGLIKEGNEQSPLHDLQVNHLYLGGYSQSAVETAAFASAFHESTRMDDGSPIFDGYLPAARSASLTQLQSGDAPLPGFEFAAMSPVDVPVIDIETQSDVEGFEAELNGVVVYTNPGAATVRRADSDIPSDLFRLYELPGSPHANRIPSCDGDGSTFPTAYFVQAAATLLFAWAEDGVAPPHAPPIDLDVTDVVSVAAVDDVGNATGGIRSPFLDTPTARYEVHAAPGPLCKLGGVETPLPADALTARYGDVAGYLEEFTASLDATIGAGFLLERDRDAIIETARTRATELFGPS